MANVIYTIVDGKIVPYVNQNGKRYNHRSRHQKHLNTARAKRSSKFYYFYNSYQWHSLSNEIKERHPICQACLREYKAGKRKLENVNITQSIHHKVPLKDDWSRRFDKTNLEALCNKHHRAFDHTGFKE